MRHKLFSLALLLLPCLLASLPETAARNQTGPIPGVLHAIILNDEDLSVSEETCSLPSSLAQKDGDAEFIQLLSARSVPRYTLRPSRISRAANFKPSFNQVIREGYLSGKYRLNPTVEHHVEDAPEVLCSTDPECITREELPKQPDYNQTIAAPGNPKKRKRVSFSPQLSETRTFQINVPQPLAVDEESSLEDISEDQDENDVDRSSSIDEDSNNDWLDTVYRPSKRLRAENACVMETIIANAGWKTISSGPEPSDTRIVVYSLLDQTSEDDLYTYYSKFCTPDAPLKRVALVVDMLQISPLVGFIDFSTVEQARVAITDGMRRKLAAHRWLSDNLICDFCPAEFSHTERTLLIRLVDVSALNVFNDLQNYAFWKKEIEEEEVDEDMGWRWKVRRIFSPVGSIDKIPGVFTAFKITFHSLEFIPRVINALGQQSGIEVQLA